MVRPVGAFLMMFALLSLIVHQIGIFEFLLAFGTALVAVDVVLARYSRDARANDVREPLL
jgi:hypothetical protein